MYRYEGRDPDPSAKRFTAALGAATIIAPWATYTLVDTNVGAAEAINNIATNVFIAYGGVAAFLSLLVFGRGLFFVSMQAIVAALLPLALVEIVFLHSEFMAPFYAEIENLTYHRIGLLLLLGVYAAFLYDLVRNGAADIISRQIWLRDGAAPPPAPKPKRQEQKRED